MVFLSWSRDIYIYICVFDESMVFVLFSFFLCAERDARDAPRIMVVSFDTLYIVYVFFFFFLYNGDST